MKLVPTYLFLCLVALWASSWASTASSHEFWLEPEKSRSTPGEEVLVSLAVGQNFIGDTIPFIPESAVRFDVYGPGGVIDQAGRHFAADPAGVVRPAGRSGLYTVAYQNTGNQATIGADLFNKYLLNEGLDHILAYRRANGLMEQPGREFYTRFPKTWVLAGDNIEAGRWALAPSGLKFELVPQSNPFLLRAGDTWSLQLLYDNKPISGIQINTFTKQSEGRIQAVRTDLNGRATISIDRAGRWLIAAVHAIPAPDSRPEAKWESFWASVTLDVPER